MRISPRTVAYTDVCEHCVRLGKTFAIVEGLLPIGALHGNVVCAEGHRLGVERPLG